MSFEEFGLDPRCLKVLASQHITKPTPIQRAAIPVILQGRDVIGTAQTGTGKTLGFALPSLTLLAREKKVPRNAMLVLVPTRELCAQVQDVMRDYGGPLGIHSVAVFGGMSLDKQAQELRRGREVVVATPGRLLDHLSRNNVQFDHLKILVLDESDRMLDMGFLPDILRILRRLPEQRQTLLFSATFPDEIARLTDRIMRNPERISVGAVAKPVDTVRQILYPVRPEDKNRLLIEILDSGEVTSALVFLRTKSRTERLAHLLRRKNYKVAELHGDRSQRQRIQALEGFREGRYKFLIATDVAARGLDIEGVSHVINFDIPLSPDDYIHRIGRTARAQAEGDAITFVCPTEYKALESIERALAHNIPRADWPDAPRVLSLFHPPQERSARPTRIRRRRPARRR